MLYVDEEGGAGDMAHRYGREIPLQGIKALGSVLSTARREERKRGMWERREGSRNRRRTGLED